MVENMPAGSEVIFAGDLNTCKDMNDRNTLGHLGDTTRIYLKDFIGQLELIDCWGVKALESYRYTWENLWVG